jgi:hypothetical protein
MMNNSDDDVIFDGCVGGANRGLNDDDLEESCLQVQSGNANPGITTDENSTSSPEKENQQPTIEQEVNKDLDSEKEVQQPSQASPKKFSRLSLAHRRPKKDGNGSSAKPAA